MPVETQPARSDWHSDLASAIRDPEELVARLGLPPSVLDGTRRGSRLFPLLVTESFLARMQPGDPDDPLLLQVLPRASEFTEVEGFTTDAVADMSSRRAAGLIHKYPGRALLIATGSCAVHCRYCFRRHYPYGDEPRRLDEWEPALATLREDPSITEIILSGGDPLMLTDRRLGELVTRLETINQLTRLRLHTRLPVVLPSRVTTALLDLLNDTRLTTIVVIHANHPAEISGDCEAALRRLVRGGLAVLNQAVLLRGINDNVDALSDLCSRLADLGVMPYYLHQLDRVAGTAGFEVPESTGRDLVRQLADRLPGYAVPQYVREVPGAESKIRLV